MPRHDYRCRDCDAVKRDVILKVVPKHLACPACDSGKMFVTYEDFHFNSHEDGHRHNAMYGKYHVGFGEVVRDYGHKQELLKKYEVSESADAVGGSKSWRDQMPENKQSESFSPGVELTEAEARSMMSGKPSAELTRRLNKQVEKDTSDARRS